jgi:hypothetical protein
MARDTRILIEHGGIERAFAWIGLLDDGSISVGLSDRLFAVPVLASEVVLEGVVHRQTADLRATHGEQAIRNPHFTFHPSAYYHLHANGEDELFSGLLMVDLVVETEGRLPWIRAVSNVVAELKPYQGARPGQNAEIIRLPVPNETCSVELAVDFVASTQSTSATKNFRVEWGGRTVEVSARHVDPQRPTLWWNHES